MRKDSIEGWGVFLSKGSRELIQVLSQERRWAEEYLEQQRPEVQAKCCIRRVKSSDWPRPGH